MSGADKHPDHPAGAGRAAPDVAPAATQPQSPEFSVFGCGQVVTMVEGDLWIGICSTHQWQGSLHNHRSSARVDLDAHRSEIITAHG